tara:strand:+ start:2890 stop:3921 length:1032 start_codon:yes stop_codon:yes gene_type:complete
MGISNWNAGIIRPIPVAPAGPYSDGAAPGVWTLDQVAYWTKQGLWPIAGNSKRGLFVGGEPYSNVIDYVNIATTGNATDFGDLTVQTYSQGSLGSNTRALFGGGFQITPAFVNVIEYATFLTTGNATDFGDLTIARYYLTALSNSTRGIWAGGYTSGGYAVGNQNVIDYVTISTLGNATDFGDISVKLYQPAGCASSTRGIIGGGINQSSVTVSSIYYITISTTGNTTSFGNLLTTQYAASSCSSSTRGIFAAGYGPSNVIEYITIATTGNSTDFGDLLTATYYRSACSSTTRGLIGGGFVSAARVNVIEYITIESIGNSTDFGDLTVARDNLSACSNSHGGL